MKFAHMGDCHLGGWRQPELQALNLESFQYAIGKSIAEKVEFVLITGDLFDSAYPPIDTLKDTFREFRRLHDSKIPVFLIAGSHDYSASGKTFLDVLSHSGFCINVSKFEERNGKIMLLPTLYKGCAIYGYPGKKSGLEVDEINRSFLQDAPGVFKILMLHTAIRDAVGTLPIPAVEEKLLPKVDYLALSHLHIDYAKENRIYSGPIFPNNLQELEELKAGSFYIFDNGKVKKEIINLKEILPITVSIKNALSATSLILSELESQNLKNKIVILSLSGILEQGNITDIDFQKIELFVKSKGAHSLIKSTSKLHHLESESLIDFSDNLNIEERIVEKFLSRNSTKFDSLSELLLKSLQMEKMDEEKASNFEERLISEINKVIPQ